VELLKTIRAFVLESGLTAVAVLHDLSLAWNFCDTLLLLHNGGVYRTGSPDTVLTQQNIEAVYGISVQFACFGEHTYVLPRL
jgi:iron complex transport system ATP-binding protein